MTSASLILLRDASVSGYSRCDSCLRTTQLLQLAPTLEPIYRRRLATSHPPPPPPPTPHSPLPLLDLSFWSRWTRSPVVDMLSLPHSLHPVSQMPCGRPFSDATSHLHTKISSTGPSRPSCRWVSANRTGSPWRCGDSELESISHAMFHCRFLVGAFEVDNAAFRSTRPHPFDVAHLLQDDKLASLETPAGLISRSTIITNWSPCCAKKQNSFFRITWESFCAKWFHTLNSWTSCPRYLPFPETVLAWFLGFLQRSSQPRPIPPTTAPKPTPTRNPFTNTPPTPPPSKQQARITARRLRKLQKAEELQEVLQDLSDGAIPLVYTDGSSAVEGYAGCLAGYGIFCDKQVFFWLRPR